MASTRLEKLSDIGAKYQNTNWFGKALLHAKHPFRIYGAKCLLEEKNLAHELARKEKLDAYALIFKKAKFAVAIGDEEGNILKINPAFSKMFGYSEEELAGRNYGSLVFGGEAAFAEKMIKSQLGAGQDYLSMDLMFTRKDGSFFWGDAGTVLLPLNGGVRKNSIIVIMDISGEKKLEEQLEEQMSDLQRTKADLVHTVKLKDKFFSIISHDLRTPFQALIGYSEILASGGYEGEQDMKTVASQLNIAAKSAYKLLDNLLAWANASGGKMKMDFKNLDLREIAAEQAATQQAKADLKKITLENLVPEGMEVFADRDTLSTAIRNLASNAIKFTQENGRVEIGALKEGLYVYAWVADNGPGLDPEVRSKLFKEKITTRSTSGEEGTGLGLMLVKEFVERNNGGVSVESEPGKGTKFTIAVPASEDAVPAIDGSLREQ
ncbi:MAG: PAS domain-containing sensor histidine kinase [Candidatus Micrarchaeia archaeon]